MKGGLRRCFDCGLTKRPSSFYPVKSKKDSRCKKCTLRYNNDRYKNDPEFKERAKTRASKYYRTAKGKLINQNAVLRYNFKIDLLEYNRLVDSQNNLCAICNNPETQLIKGKLKNLAIDHCHSSGIIRGLLCFSCNTGLGKFKDSEDILMNAINYIRKYSNVD